MNKEQVVGELSKVRGAIPLPAAMTRRGFVAGAGAAVAAAAMAGTALADQALADAPEAGAAEVAPTTAGMQFTGNEGKTMGEVLGAGWLGEEPEITDITQTLATHIVVCGADHAGTAVARHAAELGSDVIVVDPQTEENFMVLGNDVGHLNSSWQMDVNGVPRYDETEFMNEYQIYGAGRANPKYVRDFAYRSGEAFDWFIDGFTDEEKADITCLNWPVVDGYNYRKGIFTSYVGTSTSAVPWACRRPCCATSRRPRMPALSSCTRPRLCVSCTTMTTPRSRVSFARLARATLPLARATLPPRAATLLLARALQSKARLPLARLRPRSKAC